MSFYAKYPASGTNPSVGIIGDPAPLSATLVGGVDSLGNLIPFKTNTTGEQNVDVTHSVLPDGAATEAKQDDEITQLTSIAGSVGSIDTNTIHVDTDNVTVVSSALPTGASTEAKQDVGNASLASIDTKLTSPISVTGPLTDTELRASAVPVSVASLPLPTGAATEATLSAFSDKTAAGFVPEAFDETVLTYVGATTKIDTVTYKLAAATVATLTLSYDGSDRLIDVVKS